MSNEDTSKFKVVIVHPGSKHAVKLPKDIGFKDLVAYVKKKVDATKAIGNCDVRLSYNDGSMSLDIVDDDDVQYFIHDVCCMNEETQKLFISITEQPLEVKSSYASNHISVGLNVPLLPGQDHHPTPKVEDFSFHPQPDSVAVWQKISFQNIPIPPKAPTPIIKNIQPHIKSFTNDTRFYKLREFYNKQECMFAIGKKSLLERFEYVVIKSDTTRYSVKCTKDGCHWNIYTHKMKVGNKFYVSNVNDVHTCSRTQLCPNHRNATMKLLSHLLYEKMKDNSRTYKVNDIIKDIKVDWNVDLLLQQSMGRKEFSVSTVKWYT